MRPRQLYSCAVVELSSWMRGLESFGTVFRNGCVGPGMDAWVRVFRVVFRNSLSEWMRGFESFGTVFRNGCVGPGMDAWVEGLSVKSLSEIPKVDAPVDGRVFGLSERSFGMWMVGVGSSVFRNGLSECGWSGSKWMVGSLVFRNSLSECGRPRPQPRRGGIAGGVLNSWSEVKWGGLAGSCGRAGGGLGRGRRRSFGHSVFPSGEDRGDAQSTLLSQTGEQSVLSETTESASLSRARSVANRRARAVEKGNESALSETSQQSAFCRKPPRERCRKPLSTRSVANREQSALLCPLQAWSSIATCNGA